MDRNKTSLENSKKYVEAIKEAYKNKKVDIKKLFPELDLNLSLKIMPKITRQNN